MPERLRRVLIADDDADIRAMLGSIVRRREMIVDEAANGREALELLKNNAYAVILLDLLMPDVDALAVLEALRAPGSGSPVVLVITGPDRSIVERLDTQRIHGAIRKPFDPEEVADLVVACAEIRGRIAFETMAISAMIAGGPLLAWLNRFGG